uniref:Uncharacterized protein n=1 Tax=Parascaris univalens TaxID=6257 RepID=A0A915BF60_PARUN
MSQTFAVLLLLLAVSSCQPNLSRSLPCTCPPPMCTCVPTNDSSQVSCSCIPPEECACSAQEQQQDCIPICQDVCQAQCTGQTCGPLCQSICTDSCTNATILMQQNVTTMDLLPAGGDSSTSTLSPTSDLEQEMSASVADDPAISTSSQTSDLEQEMSTSVADDPTISTSSQTSDLEQGLSTSAVGDPTISTSSPTSDSEQGMSASPVGNNETGNAQQAFSSYPQVGDQSTTDTSSQNTGSVLRLQTDEPLTLIDQTTSSDPSNATDLSEQGSTNATQQPTDEQQPAEQTVRQTTRNETNTTEPSSYVGCTICFQFRQQPYQQTYQPYVQQPYYSAPQVYSMPQPQPQYYPPPQTYVQPQQACPSCMPTVTITFCNLCATGICCK